MLFLNRVSHIGDQSVTGGSPPPQVKLLFIDLMLIITGITVAQIQQAHEDICRSLPKSKGYIFSHFPESVECADLAGQLPNKTKRGKNSFSSIALSCIFNIEDFT